MITVYDCFAFESLCIQMLKNKVEWSLEKKRKEKSNDKKKKDNVPWFKKRKKKKRKRIKINRPFQMVIYPSPQLSQKEL